MVNNAPLSPDPYRDNEKHVTNFADHLRQKASQEQRDISLVASEEVHRFRDVMFGVNTQYDGHQLRLRDISTGKVINKIKKGAQLKIIPDAFAETMDDDRNRGNPDEHLWVEVEVDAADTEAGGTGKVRGWVSTEYINALGVPVEAAPVDPVLDNPESWGDEEIPPPPEPRLSKPEEPKNDQVQPITPKPEEPKNDQVQPITPKPEEPKNDQVQPITPKPEEPTTPESEQKSKESETPATNEGENPKTPTPEKNKTPDSGEKILGEEELLGSTSKGRGWKEFFKQWFHWGAETKTNTKKDELIAKTINSAPEKSEEKKVITNPLG